MRRYGGRRLRGRRGRSTRFSRSGFSRRSSGYRGRSNYNRRLASVTNLLRRPQVFSALYTQQQTVGANQGYPKCFYYATESENTILTRDQITTITLNCNKHLAVIADVLAKGTLHTAQGVATSNETFVSFDLGTRITINHSSVKYTFRNQSTDLCRVTAYYCKARQDTNVKNITVATLAQTSVFNLYLILARGFAQNGIDPSDITTTNDAMDLASYTPKNSFLFTSFFKITKAKRVTIGPGRMMSLGMKSRPFTYRPHKYFETAGSASSWNSFNNAERSYLYNRFEQFILFRVEPVAAGKGAAQATYFQLASQNSPTFILSTTFRYTANALIAYKTPHGVIEQSGFTAQTATPNTIINVESATLSEEKDAN